MSPPSEFIRTTQSAVWIGRRVGKPGYDVEAVVRWIGGIYFFSASDYQEDFLLRDLLLTAYREGLYSPRPYDLEKPADRSCGHCLLALVLDLCKHRGLDALAHRVTGRTINAEFDELRQQAEWEGLKYPQDWTPAHVEKLKERLREMSWPILALLIDALLRANGPT